MIFKDSKIAHKYLDGLTGIEIGSAKHNPFNIANCKFVDAPNNENWIDLDKSLCSEHLKPDYIAYGDDLPFEDGSLDYVLTSHVMEHFWNPIKAILEHLRVIRAGGIVFAIVPHKDRTDEPRAVSGVSELVDRFENKIVAPDPVGLCEHYSVWKTEDYVELCQYIKDKFEFDFTITSHTVDDKVENGFIVILSKSK